jgi:hypothetical protein
MNGTEHTPQVVTALLPSGEAIKVEVTGSDGMASVGEHKLDLNSALDKVSEIGKLVVEKLKEAKWVGGKGEASLTVTMEWSASAAPPC